MCNIRVYRAKCSCYFHFYDIAKCPKFQGTERTCENLIVRLELQKWESDYCHKHEALRRQFDARVMLRGQKTEHGYNNKSKWAEFLRATGDLRDKSYYSRPSEPDNPYSRGVSEADVADSMVLKKMKDIGGNFNDEEGWSEFRVRRGGKTYEPRFPGGRTGPRAKHRRTIPLVPLPELYPELAWLQPQQGERAVGPAVHCDLSAVDFAAPGITIFSTSSATPFTGVRVSDALSFDSGDQHHASLGSDRPNTNVQTDARNLFPRGNAFPHELHTATSQVARISDSHCDSRSPKKRPPSPSDRGRIRKSPCTTRTRPHIGTSQWQANAASATRPSHADVRSQKIADNQATQSNEISSDPDSPKFDTFGDRGSKLPRPRRKKTAPTNQVSSQQTPAESNPQPSRTYHKVISRTPATQTIGVPSRSLSWDSNKLTAEEEYYAVRGDYLKANIRRQLRGKDIVDFTGDWESMRPKRYMISQAPAGEDMSLRPS